MARQELEFSTRLTREDVAGLIEALIEGLKNGVLKVQKSGETLELEVPRVVDLEIEASIDEERAEFEIEVSWRTNRAENPDIGFGAADTPDGGETAGQAGSSPAKAARKRAASGKTASGTAKKSAPAKKRAKAGSGGKNKASAVK